MFDNSTIQYKLGQVGGFPLRLSWLPRLVVRGDPLSFNNPDSIALDMGIGRNMVKALRIWAMATGIVNEDKLTIRAKQLFSSRDGKDKYAENDETLWLLHWLTCSNLDCFTANGWLLNFFHSRSFTADEALDAFDAHINSLKRRYAIGTIRVDLETAIRMYAVIHDKNKQSDIDDRCFCVMGLLSASRTGGETRYARIFRDEQPRLSSQIILYSVIDAMSKRKSRNSSFSDLYTMDSMPAPGIVFGLTKDGFLTALEKAANKSKVLSLHTMPDGDFQVRLKGKHAEMAECGDKSAADYFYFSLKQ